MVGPCPQTTTSEPHIACSTLASRLDVQFYYYPQQLVHQLYFSTHQFPSLSQWLEGVGTQMLEQQEKKRTLVSSCYMKEFEYTSISLERCFARNWEFLTYYNSWCFFKVWGSARESSVSNLSSSAIMTMLGMSTWSSALRNPNWSV